MNKVYADKGELWPYYSHSFTNEYTSRELNIDDETLNRWNKACEEFFQYQEELRKLIDPKGTL